jgi:hypothetical protein
VSLSADELATIARLEKDAAKLRAQFDSGFAKRPLIIEFSGLPKAGKTRMISILELFLKRNGFKVDVFIERASIAPIRTKGHLNFNTWVSCASLQGMLEALSKPELDVFILDRGCSMRLSGRIGLLRRERSQAMKRMPATGSSR